MDVEVMKRAQDAALKHLGYDSIEDAHYWAKDDYDLNRLDALIAVIGEAISAALTTAQAQAAAQEQRIAKLEKELHHISRTCEMSAGIMQDKRRTGGWEGAEKTADAFNRIARRARAALGEQQ